MSELCVFVLWERARPWEERILDDLGRRFELCDVVDVTWPPARFGQFLTRLYGEALPAGSEKERACGTGPFLVVAARDPAPRYRLRRTTGGGIRRVNARAARAKRRYRRWAGGDGFRVHGSLDAAEAERDLRLLLRLAPGDVVERAWDGTVHRTDADPVSWESGADLLATVGAATPASLVSDDGTETHLAVEDVWWAAAIAGGEPPAADAREAVVDARVGGAPRRVRITQRTP